MSDAINDRILDAAADRAATGDEVLQDLLNQPTVDLDAIFERLKIC